MLLHSLLLSPLVLTPATSGDDWPHLRGPRLDGSVPAESLEGLGSGGVGLRTVWKAPLGPSYSGVSIAAGHVLTTFSDGAKDWVVALSQADGAVAWKHELGEIYLGHDGSEDGPISSPVIDGDTVFAIGPRGALLALALDSGEVRWSTHLVDDLGATLPEYGFTTTPLVEGDVLIVQAGGTEGRLVCGFDKATGELRWSAGDGEAGYVSPCGMDLAGTRTVVVLNGPRILGLAPENGAVLWVHEVGEQGAAWSGIPGALDGDRFHAPGGGGIGVYRVSAAETGFAVEAVSQSRDLGRTYAAPVYSGGHLYGFKSDFLTCVDAETGKRAWRSRPPGGKGLILLGERLLVFGAEGVVAVVRATPEGYEEESRLEVLEHSSYVWPSFAGGRLYVRNNAELACVELVPSGGPVAAAAESVSTGLVDTSIPGVVMGDFLATLAGAEDPSAAIDEFLASNSVPVVEGDTVHFLFRGEAEDVAIVGSMVEGGSEPLARIDGTDLFHRAFRIEPGARWEYVFQVDYEQLQPDELNPRRIPGGRGELSELVTEGYVTATHFEEPAEGAARGRTETYEFVSEQLENTREVTVYLPAGYDESEQAYPLLIVHQGPDYLANTGFTNTLDNLIGSSVRPLVVAFVPPPRAWWFEGGGSGTTEYVDMLASEFLADIGARYRLLEGPEHRALLGRQSFGLTVAYAGLAHPEAFGLVAIQSPAIEDVARHALYELIETEPREDVRFHLDWNRYERKLPDEGVDHRADARRLDAALREAGFEVTGGEALDAAGWGACRARTDDVLEAFFPAE